MCYFLKKIHKTVFAILETRVTRHTTHYARKTFRFKSRKHHSTSHRTPTLLHNDPHLKILPDRCRRFHINGETPERTSQHHVLPTQKGTIENHRRVVHNKPVAKRTKLVRVADQDFVGAGIFWDQRHDLGGRPIFVTALCSACDNHNRSRAIDCGDCVIFRRRLVWCLRKHVRICVCACVS